jgi:hypothetical protein
LNPSTTLARQRDGQRRRDLIAKNWTLELGATPPQNTSR